MIPQWKEVGGTGGGAGGLCLAAEMPHGLYKVEYDGEEPIFSGFLFSATFTDRQGRFIKIGTFRGEEAAVAAAEEHIRHTVGALCSECGRTFKSAGTLSATQLLDYHVIKDHAEPRRRIRKTVPRGLGAAAREAAQRATAERINIQARDLRTLLAENGVPPEYRRAALAAVRSWLFDVQHFYRMQPDCGDEQSAVWAMEQLLGEDAHEG